MHTWMGANLNDKNSKNTHKGAEFSTLLLAII